LRLGVGRPKSWRRTLTLALATLLATSAFAASFWLAMAQVPLVGASAEIRDASGRLIANADLREGRGEVLITLTFATPPALTGTHGFRIHEVGRCDAPDFATAGNGFNPFNKKHGRQNPDGPQVGDLPNVNFVTGLTSYNTSAVGATLAQGPASLLGTNGTALIIYSGEDDQLTDPDGKAGNRIACGVINPVNAAAASPVPAAAGGGRPATSPVPGQQQPGAPGQPQPGSPGQQQPGSPGEQQPGAPGQPQAAQGQRQAGRAPTKPAASPSVAPPPVVARPAASPTAVSSVTAASPVAPVLVAVPTAAAPSAAPSTSQSGGGLGTVPALLIAVLGVGLVGAGYLLRRRAQLQRH
jgi:superoxide dismutase, Cu-Zn family